MLTLRIGNRAGYSFRVKPRLELLNQRQIAPHVIEGQVDTFRRLAIMRGRAPKYELIIIQPGDEENEIISRPPGETGDSSAFFVRGRFEIVSRTGGRKALAAYESFPS